MAFYLRSGTWLRLWDLEFALGIDTVVAVYNTLAHFITAPSHTLFICCHPLRRSRQIWFAFPPFHLIYHHNFTYKIWVRSRCYAGSERYGCWVCACTCKGGKLDVMLWWVRTILLNSHFCKGSWVDILVIALEHAPILGSKEYICFFDPFRWWNRIWDMNPQF